MGILYDDVVIIRQAEKEGDPSVITVNCPDKTGLGCDLCHILLFFSLNIVRGASGISYYRSELQSPRPPDVFLLKLCCYDRKGLLHDVTEVLCSLELNIKKVKVSTTPDGTVMDLFFITDTRELLHTKNRQEETHKALEDVMQDAIISFNLEKVGPGITACSQASPFLPPAITEDIFNIETSNDLPSVSLTSSNVCVTMDNSLNPAHTLVQIVC
ncbi:hypothetical protein V6N12_035690 [Hibiscus sabdariffa]|uniref:ACT domain-containing protein ACR n=1 Tax=Hibiscus sabdariffa TaxID=183260 RepID=A0ABR2ENH5_9ROSI